MLEPEAESAAPEPDQGPRQTGKTKGAILLSGVRFLSLAVNFLSVPFLLAILGEGLYGGCLFAVMLSRYFWLMDPGFSDGAQLRMYQSHHEEDRAETARVWSNHITLAFAYSFLGALLLFAVGVAIPLKDFDSSRVALFGAAAVQFFFITLFNANQLLHSTRRQFQVVSTLNALNGVGGMVSAVVLTAIFRTPAAYVLGLAVGSCAAVTYGMVHSVRSLPREHIKFGIQSGLAREFLKVGWRNFPNRVGSVLSGTADRFLVTGTLGTIQNTHLNNSAKLSDATNDLLGSLTQTSQPELASAALKGDEAFGQALERNGRIVLAVASSFVLVPAGFAAVILTVWLGQRQPPDGEILMLGAGVYGAFQALFSLIGAAFFVRGQAHRILPFVLWNGLTTLLATIPLTHWFGLAGVAYLKIGIQTLQWYPLLVYTQRHIAPTLSAGRFFSATLRILLIAGAYCGVGMVVSKALADRGLHWVGVLLMPIFVVLSLGTIFAFRLADLPAPIKKLVRKFRPS